MTINHNDPRLVLAAAALTGFCARPQKYDDSEQVARFAVVVGDKTLAELERTTPGPSSLSQGDVERICRSRIDNGTLAAAKRAALVAVDDPRYSYTQYQLGVALLSLIGEKP